MDKPSTCDKCGGNRLQSGSISSLPLPTAFYLGQRRTFSPKGVRIYALACPDCGALTLSVDAAQLEAVMAKNR
jgi:hypothetical protein